MQGTRSEIEREQGLHPHAPPSRTRQQSNKYLGQGKLWAAVLIAHGEPFPKHHHTRTSPVLRPHLQDFATGTYTDNHNIGPHTILAEMQWNPQQNTAHLRCLL